jgi:glycosyltransferase involved in cell wall biosynthesis
LPAEARVVSFVARQADQLRGLDRFLELSRRLTARDANVLCVIAGAPVVERGLDVWHYNQDYWATASAAAGLENRERIWYLGRVPPSEISVLLAASALHVYPSRPYPVAHSLLEAMAAGAVVLAADTAPVREVITPGRTGLLVPAADNEAWLAQAAAVLDNPSAYRPLGEAAAAVARAQFSQDATLPELAALFDQLVDKRR